jgi:hypothetical protein
MNVGIDKIILTAKDYRIQPKNSLKTNYTTDCNGNIERTNKYLDLGDIMIDTNTQGIRIITNPSKVIGKLTAAPPNYLIKTADELNTALQIATDHVAAAGIDLPPESGIRINRIDHAKDMITDHPAENYFPAIAMLGTTRMKKRNEETTYYAGNKQRQFCFYNKTADIAQQTKGNIEIDENTSRIEFRALKTHEVDVTLNIKTLAELRNYTPDRWQADYTHLLKTQFFNISHADQLAAAPTLTIAHQLNLINYFGGQRNFEKILGHAALLEYYGSIETMKTHLQAAGGHRSAIHRKLAAVQKAFKQKGVIDKYYNKETTATLLHELITKFALAA